MNIRSTLRFRYSLVSFTLLSTIAAAAADKYLFYVGTYTEKTESKGIYAYRLDPATGTSTPLGLAAETTNPSFVALHPNGKFLYAVNEVGNYKGPNSGGVSAFSVDPATGKLTLLNEVPSRGADPFYIIVDKAGKHVLVANYTSGNIAVFPIGDDGKLSEASTFIQLHRHGPDPKRQEGPHAHSINLSPDQRFAFVDDLGLDELLAYKYDEDKGSLTANDPPFVKLDPGAGPRHFDLHPSGRFAYVVAEMQSTVTALSVDLKNGSFHRLQTISTLPNDYVGENDDDEIHVYPNGQFLYASNRGRNSIAVFAIDQSKGTLTRIDDVPTQGKIPRSFEIDPTGRFLFAENQQSNDIVVFRIDEKKGKLKPTGQKLDVASPVCVKFLSLD